MATKTKKPEECYVSVAMNVQTVERSTKRKPARITFASHQGKPGHTEFEKLVDTLIKQSVGGYFGPVNVRGLSLQYNDHTGIAD